MKRILFFVGVAMLLGCGMLKTSRSPASEIEAAPVSSPVTITWDRIAVVKHVNAFTIDDLYRSRENTIKRSNRHKFPVINNVTEIQEADELTQEQSEMVEVIQIVDEETGTVVAAKIVNK